MSRRSVHESRLMVCHIPYWCLFWDAGFKFNFPFFAFCRLLLYTEEETASHSPPPQAKCWERWGTRAAARKQNFSSGGTPLKARYSLKVTAEMRKETFASVFQALRSCDKSSKPVYVSVGHKISLDTAVRLTRACCLFRVPEPIRQVETFCGLCVWWDAVLHFLCTAKKKVLFSVWKKIILSKKFFNNKMILL